MYDYFINNKIEWNDKKNMVFWSGNNTNSIRTKIHEASILTPNFYINMFNKNKSNFIPLNEIRKFKFLLNMNGRSYAGRLNYLFL